MEFNTTKDIIDKAKELVLLGKVSAMDVGLSKMTQSNWMNGKTILLDNAVNILTQAGIEVEATSDALERNMAIVRSGLSIRELSKHSGTDPRSIAGWITGESMNHRTVAAIEAVVYGD